MTINPLRPAALPASIAPASAPASALASTPPSAVEHNVDALAIAPTQSRATLFPESMPANLAAAILQYLNGDVPARSLRALLPIAGASRNSDATIREYLAALHSALMDPLMRQSIAGALHQVQQGERTMAQTVAPLTSLFQRHRPRRLRLAEMLQRRYTGIPTAHALTMIDAAMVGDPDRPVPPIRLEGLDLDNNHLGAAGAGALAMLLESQPALNTLHLQRNYLGAAALRALSPALATSAKLGELDLSDTQFDAPAAAAFAASLQQLTALHTLKLSATGMTPQLLEQITPALRQQTSMRVLELANNRLQQDQAASLAALLAEMPALISLNLATNNFDAAAGAAMAAPIAAMRRLQRLDFSGNPIGAHADDLFNRLLANKPAMQTLRLRYVGLEAQSLSALHAELQVMQQLQSLHLDGNRVADAITPDLAALLAQNGSLHTLSLRQTGLHAAALTALRTMHEAGSLRALDLSLNPLGDQLEALAQNRSNLEQLHLRQVALFGQGLPALTPLLPHLPELRVLDLSMNGLDAPALVALAASLPRLQKLTQLDLGQNPIEFDSIDALLHMAGRMPALRQLDLGESQLTPEQRAAAHRRFAELPAAPAVNLGRDGYF